jgi:hypothetical protein
MNTGQKDGGQLAKSRLISAISDRTKKPHLWMGAAFEWREE